jgi:hypothetical protein
MSTQQHWTFKKEVSVGDLVAIVLAIGGVFTAYFTLKADIEVLKSRITTQELVADSLKQEIYNRLNRIDDKLDRLVERNTRLDK